MPEIGVDPAAMRAFARDLAEYCEQLRREEMSLRTSLDQLGQSWKDEKFGQFRKNLEVVSAELARFYPDAQKYADFLGRKAAAAERFLR
ncbi:WXG100 family type VII secretion target [Rhodoferax sp. 4810]|nr:WXG100 family type VII secretion target [Rhodoferax jenense]